MLNSITSIYNLSKKKLIKCTMTLKHVNSKREQRFCLSFSIRFPVFKFLLLTAGAAPDSYLG